MARMLSHPHRPMLPSVPRSISPMVYRLRRQTPTVGYAEVEVISHPNSHHRTGDVVLIGWDEYESGQFIHPPDNPPFEPQTKTKELSQVAADFLAINPHARTMADGIPPKGARKNDTRRKSKSKNKPALKKL